MIFIVFCIKFFDYIMTVHSKSLFFGSNVYEHLTEYLSQTPHSKIFVLVDDNTKKYCLPNLYLHLEHPFEVLQIPSGEGSKTIQTAIELWQKLIDAGADKKSILINLGGGVVTDIGGFVALTFKRGFKFVNIPTTLLGMVDAAVGGKTGIDFNGLKNQIGLISPPEMVLVDSVYLKTLPKRELKSGMAEVLKYGLIADEYLWNYLVKKGKLGIDDSVIQQSAEIKKHIVCEDVMENGLRKTLNFGHTFGHAIETHFLTKPVEKHLLHGEAVVVGMILATHLSYQTQGLSEDRLNEITHVLLKNYPKVTLSNTDLQEIVQLLIHDKKNDNGQINFVLIQEIAKPVWDCKVTENQMNIAIDYYLNL